MSQVDVVIVGGGHNGLACAAYLARAGRSTVVVEARDTVGGCASTVDAVGARVNVCHCDHTMVLASGIVEELDLASYGLRYLDVDPMQIAVGWRDEPVFVQWRDVERTISGLARVDRAAATAYRRYVAAATPVARLMLAATRARPGTASLVAAGAGRGAGALLAWGRRSLLEVLTSFGLPPWLQAAIATTGPGVWGLSPDAAGTGLGALGPVTRHLVGVGRPAGGSGALPDALAAAVRAHGGEIRTGCRVVSLLVDGGAARGVRLSDGTAIEARNVVTAIDPRTVVVDWLRGVPAAARIHARWVGAPAPDGYESKVDAVVDRPPTFRAVAALSDDVLPASLAQLPTTVVSPSPRQQVAAAVDRVAGRIGDPPMFLVNSPSVLDPAMRPAGGGHLLSLEVLWTPYALAGGWASSDEPRRWLELLAGLAEPGFLDGVRDWRVMTPVDYEREFGLPRGYAPSFPGGVAAALWGRRPELSRYRTPVSRLFLTGAGTFPGAGVWGASGRNTANAILR
jgi:phytoene dehydrogenase-like protein